MSMLLCFEVVSPLPRLVSCRDLKNTAAELVHVLNLPRASSVSLRFVSAAVMTKINHTQRGRSVVTDVLSFAVADELRALTPPSERCELGDLIICSSQATAEARRRGVDAHEEHIRLIVHGVLHLNGYDHATAVQEAHMFALQERIVSLICPVSVE